MGPRIYAISSSLTLLQPVSLKLTFEKGLLRDRPFSSVSVDTTSPSHDKPRSSLWAFSVFRMDLFGCYRDFLGFLFLGLYMHSVAVWIVLWIVLFLGRKTM